MAGAVAAAIISGVVGAGASKLLAGKPKSDPALAAAQKRQVALQESQQAAQTRLQQQTDAREADLDKQLSATMRASAARRRGRGGLSFNGANTGLKSTLGG